MNPIQADRHRHDLSRAAPGRSELDVLFDKYAESHRHPTNKAIHFVCVPAITLSLLGLLWSLHPAVAIAFALAALVYYARLSVPLMLGMVGMSAAMLALLALTPLARYALVVFVVAWIGQFIGHKIEGKKPSFFDDLRFLLIGPFWVLSFLYKRLGLST